MDISKLIQNPKMNHLNKFRRKHSVPRNIYKEILEQMFQEFGDKKEHHFYKTKQKQREFIDNISQNFERFLELITEKTGKTFRKRIHWYDDWDSDWNEANLDGSFAYNGVTEDF